ncbi:OB-fold nucleic acid binding domain, AA-tRNA synthetase-type [Ostreococcus tauri]|uniref:CST complex subunit STN1 n=1 Tax=Ostreococcus tauri TaxID=70448 RepID=A0A090M492_OSTTA|nr:OB-fold nucleic acid binding domain, AA-tRNA synthetase-type [Ostreococcus tauri]OUS49327.1 hypothetical protein BE221DRAFT_188596 [Ostreococcus tauri]CEF97487.1 OB-fold nucleic acid binding domain, AA-tRNA synthetase-type [Ostreococcus tauri]|eukprot:XP_003078667.2 OB-fold nucleic acid binding domain, AA-tRNA synthetase-type [Ostreococcus tauri]
MTSTASHETESARGATGSMDDDDEDAMGNDREFKVRRRRVDAAEARALGKRQSFWCTTKCFVREILRADELTFEEEEVSEAEASERASECYELRRKVGTTIARRVEVCGYVVERRTRKDSKVIFTLDDGTGCVECVVWMQDGDAATGERSDLFGIASAADGAAALAKEIRVGSLARVQGVVRHWRGHRQINTKSVQIDLDPNQECLFWLDVTEHG